MAWSQPISTLRGHGFKGPVPKRRERGRNRQPARTLWAAPINCKIFLETASRRSQELKSRMLVVLAQE
jgi:hypothetical protein